ncbi:MAG: ECF transporter S component [Clostridia bacterium]|nr:ECF transporter S component [Clostridia bacterium]
MSVNYMLISIVILAVAIAIPFVTFEKKKPKARQIVMIAVMSALTVAANIICACTIPLHAGTALVIISGIAFGPESGFLIGVLSRFVCNFFMGQGMWTPWEMAAWGILGALAGIAFYKPEISGHFDDKKEIMKKKTQKGLSYMAVPVVCMLLSELAGYIVYIFTATEGETFFGWRLYAFGLAGIVISVILMHRRIPCNFVTVTIFTFVSVFVIYGGLMNIAAMMMNSTLSDSRSSQVSWEALKLLYITGAPYDAAHALGASVCAFLFGDGLLDKLTRARIKYGLSL